MRSTLLDLRPALAPAVAGSLVTAPPHSTSIAGPIPLGPEPDADIEDRLRDRLRALAHNFIQSNADAWSSSSASLVEGFKIAFESLEHGGGNGGGPSSSADSLIISPFAKHSPAPPEAGFSVEAMQQIPPCEPETGNIVCGLDGQQSSQALRALPLYGFPGGELFIDTPSSIAPCAQAADDDQLCNLGVPGALW